MLDAGSQAKVTRLSENCTRFFAASYSAFASASFLLIPAWRARSMDVRAPAPYNEKNQSFGREQLRAA